MQRMPPPTPEQMRELIDARVEYERKQRVLRDRMRRQKVHSQAEEIEYAKDYWGDS